MAAQSFIPGTIAKLHELKAMCERHGVSPLIEVDGGISSKNIAEVVKAGANALVAGSAVFKSEDPTAEVALLQKLGNEAATGGINPYDRRSKPHTRES